MHGVPTQIEMLVAEMRRQGYDIKKKDTTHATD
jgi:hypothetical protein